MRPPSLLLVALLALTGCDDLLPFDVAPDGRLLVAFDVAGRAAAIGDGAAPRHLAFVDPTGGDVACLTSAPCAITWPRALGQGALVVLERRTLVLLEPAGRRVLRASGRRLLQPTPSPAGDQVAVLEADRVGAPGLLLVLDARDGREVARLEQALLGFAWTSDGALLAARATAERERPLSIGPGELVALRDGSVEVLGKGPLGPAVWLAARPGGADAAIVLPRGEPPALTLNVSRLGPKGAKRGEDGGAVDLWPCVDAGGRLLFTRSVPGRPTLEGELRLGSLDDLAGSTQVPTQTPACAPRWVGSRVAYLTPGDHLVVQELDGSGRLDLTSRLKAAFGESP